jgi:hypothetical protein
VSFSGDAAGSRLVGLAETVQNVLRRDASRPSLNAGLASLLRVPTTGNAATCEQNQLSAGQRARGKRFSQADPWVLAMVVRLGGRRSKVTTTVERGPMAPPCH